MSLLGDWNWYLPRWLEWLPRLEVEGPSQAVRRLRRRRWSRARTSNDSAPIRPQDMSRVRPWGMSAGDGVGAGRARRPTPCVKPPLVPSRGAERGRSPLRASRRADDAALRGREDVRALPARREPPRRRRRRSRNPVRHRDDEPSRRAVRAEAIRSASIALRPYNPAQDAQVFGRLSVADLGDVPVTPGNARADGVADRGAARADRPVGRRGRSASAETISSSLGELRAHAAVHGPLGLVLLDAHADVWDVYVGERYYHGSPFRRALEEGLVDPGRSLLAGHARRSLYGPEDVAMPTDLGFEVDPVRRARRARPEEYGARVRDRVGDGPLFLSFDIDVLDPAFAPGTGTPEAGGLSTREALGFLRALRGLRFSGYDVVEVSPPYDGPGQPTAVAAANVAFELLTLDVLARASDANESRGPDRGHARAHRARGRATSSGRSSSGRRSTSSRTPTSRGSRPRSRSWCLTVPVLAARWGWLLRAQGIDERLPWLTRAYFVAYTAGQILPTSLGGDAVRIVETARRHGGRTAVASGTVVLERGLGGAATVLLGAIAFVLSIGRFDVSAYVWIEGVFVFGTIVARVPLLRPLCAPAPSPRGALARACPPRPGPAGVLRERPPLPRPAAPPARRRSRSRFAVQTVRVLAIWAAAKAVGIELEVLVYYVMGPLLFLVLLVPVHAERDRRARGVLRQLPRQPRRRGRAGVRGRVPVLPRDADHGAAGRRDPALGGPARRDAAARVEHG